jgi:hypothetical protein
VILWDNIPQNHLYFSDWEKAAENRTLPFERPEMKRVHFRFGQSDHRRPFGRRAPTGLPRV